MFRRNNFLFNYHLTANLPKSLITSLPTTGSKHLRRFNPNQKAIAQITAITAPKKLLTNSPVITSSNDDPLSICHSSLKNCDIYNVHVNASLPYIKPALFVCAIDVSGSMQESASADAHSEEAKFSKLDLVKHALRTIVYTLRDVDQLAIVVFDDNAKVLFDPIKMTDDNKIIALQEIERIRECGSTNLWDGIEKVLDITQNTINNDMNVFNLVLTDGEANRGPRDILTEFTNKMKKKHVVTHMFGFGSSINHEVLFDLAFHSGGAFTYINDVSMCNTSFINYLAYCLSLSVDNIILETDDANRRLLTKSSLTRMLGNQYVLGGAQTGFARNFLVSQKSPIKFSYNGKTYTYNFTNEIDSVGVFSDNQIQYDNLNALEVMRAEFVSVVSAKIKDPACFTIEDIYKRAETQVNMFNISGKSVIYSKLKTFLDDLRHPDKHKGQIEKAFDPQFYSKWGTPYLKSWIRSHELQYCSNFKDASLQYYGGKLFNELRTEIEEIFKNIPAPKASRASASKPYTGNFTSSTYNPSGPCFAGECKAQTSNGRVPLYNLKKGDCVVDSNGNKGKIACVIVTEVEGGEAEMCTFDDLVSWNDLGPTLVVTPYHPISRDGTWVFPHTVEKVEKIKIDRIYNFVLEDHHVMDIEGYDVITMGHNYTHGILKHPLFGSQKIIDELKRLDPKGWAKGEIVITKYRPEFENGVIVSLGDTQVRSSDRVNRRFCA